MKVRGTTLRVKLTVLCWGGLTLLGPVTLAACTSGSSTTAPTVPSFSPSCNRQRLGDRDGFRFRG